ncbi:MAG: CoA-binding protein [Bacteroidales bacterium]|nr:CoA-binding protein [Bacteroidales bacterium]
MKKTLVIGASTKQHKYAYKAVCMLLDYGHEVVAIGSKPGQIRDVKIETSLLNYDAVDTVTLYINPERQTSYYDYILSLKPKRIIMNPGTENDYFKNIAINNEIEVVEHCTLVMLNIGSF